MSSFLHVRTTGTGYEVEGPRHARLGRPIEAERPGEVRQGVFADWDWDGRRLRVVNDRYGLQPLFYYQDARQVIVSDTLTQVVERGAPTELDDDALAVFLRCQLYLAEDTPFAKIRQLPPGALLEWSDGRFTLQSQPPRPRPVTLRGDDLVDVYAVLFREAIRRRLPKDDQEIVLPLSGGQDSRHILLELLDQGRPPSHCVTIARTWSPKLLDDARIAAEVTSAAALPHVVLTHDDSLFASEARKNHATNFCSADHAWFLSLVDHQDLSRSLVFDGLGGDILSACEILHDDYVTLYRDGQFDRLADLFLGPEAACRDAFNPSFYARISRERAIARLSAELARHAEALSPLTEFYFWNRTRRAIGCSPYGILNKYTTVDTPYLDADLFDFLIGRSPDRLSPDFHKKTIRASYPRFASIPFSVLSAPIADRATPFLRLARQVSRALLKGPHDDLSFFRKGYLIPRFSRSVVDARYAMGGYWLPQLVVYLSQLHAVASRKGHSRFSDQALARPNLNAARV